MTRWNVGLTTNQSMIGFALTQWTVATSPRFGALTSIKAGHTLWVAVKTSHGFFGASQPLVTRNSVKSTTLISALYTQLVGARALTWIELPQLEPIIRLCSMKSLKFNLTIQKITRLLHSFLLRFNLRMLLTLIAYNSARRIQGD